MLAVESARDQASSNSAERDAETQALRHEVGRSVGESAQFVQSVCVCGCLHVYQCVSACSYLPHMLRCRLCRAFWRCRTAPKQRHRLPAVSSVTAPCLPWATRCFD